MSPSPADGRGRVAPCRLLPLPFFTFLVGFGPLKEVLIVVVGLEVRGSEPWRGVLTPDELNKATFKPHPQAMRSLSTKRAVLRKSHFSRTLGGEPFQLVLEDNLAFLAEILPGLPRGLRAFV